MKKKKYIYIYIYLSNLIAIYNILNIILNYN